MTVTWKEPRAPGARSPTGQESSPVPPTAGWVQLVAPVTDAKVVKGLGFGLDEASVAAIRRFKFKPATKGGESVGTTLTYNFSWFLD